MTSLQRRVLATVLEVFGVFGIAVALTVLLVAPSHCQTIQRTATLRWTAAVPAPASGTVPAQILTGYNIYRATTSGGWVLGTPFATVHFGTNTYADATAGNGTWFYAVTTVCSNCGAVSESGPSNRVEVLAAPTGLKVAPPSNLNVAPK